MFCGTVRFTAMALCVNGMNMNILRALMIMKKASFCWVSSIFDVVVDARELTNKISAFHSPSLRLHLGNWRMLRTVVG